jgi:hypothetical protein
VNPTNLLLHVPSERRTWLRPIADGFMRSTELLAAAPSL